MPVGADGRNAGGSRIAQGSPGEAVNCCGEFIEQAEVAGVTTYKLEQAIPRPRPAPSTYPHRCSARRETRT